MKEAFEELFVEGQELEAGIAVTIDGSLVADLWGGYANPEHSRSWERDTLIME